MLWFHEVEGNICACVSCGEDAPCVIASHPCKVMGHVSRLEFEGQVLYSCCRGCRLWSHKVLQSAPVVWGWGIGVKVLGFGGVGWFG